jgi:hypothetical protein
MFLGNGRGLVADVENPVLVLLEDGSGGERGLASALPLGRGQAVEHRPEPVVDLGELGHVPVIASLPVAPTLNRRCVGRGHVATALQPENVVGTALVGIEKHLLSLRHNRHHSVPGRGVQLAGVAVELNLTSQPAVCGTDPS